MTVFYLLSNQAFARSINVKGSIKDSKKAPVEFANVFVVQAVDSEVVKSALTDERGTYEFTDIVPGDYRIMVVQIGYRKFFSDAFTIKNAGETISISEIGLEDISVNLKEATVSAQRPFIEHHIDKTVVNVENSIVNAGSTVLEILKRCPGVTVDNDGNIHLTGKDGVNVMIDGKQSYLSVKDLYEMLRNMNSDQLNSIEIITNPSAKYDASGNSGIINIKLKKRQDVGLNGNLHGSFGQGAYCDYSGGISLNYGKEKYNVFGGYDYGRGYYYEKTDLTRYFSNSIENSKFVQNSFSKGQYDNHNFQAGADFYFSKKHSVSGVIRGNYSLNNNRTVATTNISNTSEAIDSGYVTLNSNKTKWNNLSGTLNYTFKIDTAGQELTVDGDMAHYDNSNDFRFLTERYYSNGQLPSWELSTDDQPSKIDVKSFKADYVLPLKNNFKFEAGTKSSYVTTDNDVRYYNYLDNQPVNDTTKSNHFTYKENIHALYANISGEIKKFGFETGLRAEQTVAKGEQEIFNQSFTRDYIQLFPSAFLSYKFSDKYQTKLSYSRRIDRPQYHQLNPFRSFLDQYTFMQGNPDLKPQITDNFEFQHIFLQTISLSFGYGHTIDNMTELAKQIDSTHTTFVTTENLKSTDNYSLSVSAPIQFTEKWSSSNDLVVFNNHFKGYAAGSNIDNSKTSYYIGSNHYINLNGGWTIEINAYYQSKIYWGTWLMQSRMSLGGGISKSFLGDKLSMKLNFNDVFHTEITDASVKYSNINFHFKQWEDTQFLRLHLSYNFGKKEIKQTEHRVGADEENRIKTGR